MADYFCLYCGTQAKRDGTRYGLQRCFCRWSLERSKQRFVTAETLALVEKEFATQREWMLPEEFKKRREKRDQERLKKAQRKAA
jgi:hypothetical protein